MTKREILVRVRQAAARAWMDLAHDLDSRCPRESVHRMFEWQMADEQHRRLTQAWATLDALLDAVGRVSDTTSDIIDEKAFQLNSKVYRECHAAEVTR